MCFLSASFKPRYFYSRERAEMFSEIADGLRKVLSKAKETASPLTINFMVRSLLLIRFNCRFTPSRC